MSRKSRLNKSILLVIAFLMLLLIIIFVVLKFASENEVVISGNQPVSVNISVNDENIITHADLSELDRIKSMNERTRIEYYVSNYIKLIEGQDYEKAYSLLNSDYKKNYFSTQREFEEYCKNTFSSMLDIQYDNFERNGEIYVIWLTITDAISGRKEAGREMNFVVKENSFNDYELSFSKI